MIRFIIKCVRNVMFAVMLVIGMFVTNNTYSAVCSTGLGNSDECALQVGIQGSTAGCSSYQVMAVYNNGSTLVGCYYTCSDCTRGTGTSQNTQIGGCSITYTSCSSGVGDLCLQTCSSDADCSNGKTCQDGCCKRSSAACMYGTCSTDSDCDSDYECDDSGCCIKSFTPTACLHGACTKGPDCRESGYTTCNAITGCCEEDAIILPTGCPQGQYGIGAKCRNCSSLSMDPVFYSDTGLTTTAKNSATTDFAGATSATECYIPAGTYYDSVGTFTITKCNYSN